MVFLFKVVPFFFSFSKLDRTKSSQLEEFTLFSRDSGCRATTVSPLVLSPLQRVAVHFSTIDRVSRGRRKRRRRNKPWLW